METTPPPVKKFRTMHMTECVREFKLPRQFPSTIKFQDKNVKLNQARNVANIKVNSTNATAPKVINLLPNKDIKSGNLQRLRIKLPNGKDLGEFNVQLLPWNNDSLLGKKIVSKQNVLESVNKPAVMTVLNSQSSVKKTVIKLQAIDAKSSQAESKSTTTKPVLLHVYQPGKDDVENKRSSTYSKPIILARRSKDNVQVKTLSVKPTPVENRTDRELKHVKNIAQNSQAPKLLLLDQRQIQTSLRKDNKKISNGELLVSPKVPVSNCERLASQSNENKIVSSSTKPMTKDKCSQIVCKKEANETALNNPLKNIPNAQKKEEKKEENSTCKKTTTDVIKTTNNTVQNKRKLGDNVMVVLHDNKANWSSGNNNPNPGNHVGQRLEASCKVNDKDKEKPSQIITPTRNNSQPEKKQSWESSDTSNSSKKLSSEQLNGTWDILEKALNSVKDEKLRADALKALAACGIMAERHVPLPPASDKRIVHDSEVQTSVFSLLEPNSFVLVSEDDPHLTRISQKKQTYPPHNDKSLLEYSEDYYVDLFDLGLIVDDPQRRKNVSKVNDILSKANQKCRNIVEQLKNDFEGVLKYDEDGLLNIHKAVIENRPNDLRRQLIVLKGCKVSVDVKTQDGKTSLELAFIHNADANIVLSLLQAGAQPVSSEIAHESAVLLASKNNSPFLTRLLEHVPDASLLDVLDSAGFAAIHYCAQLNDLEGTSALIRAGANVNLKDGRSGRTALFHAVEHKNIAVAQRLVDSGALVHIPNFSGQTVAMLMDDIKSLSFRTSVNRVAK